MNSGKERLLPSSDAVEEILARREYEAQNQPLPATPLRPYPVGPKKERLRKAMHEAVENKELRRTRNQWMKDHGISSTLLDAVIRENKRRLAPACVRQFKKEESAVLFLEKVKKHKGKKYITPLLRIPASVLRQAGFEEGKVSCVVENGRIILEAYCGENVKRNLGRGRHDDLTDSGPQPSKFGPSGPTGVGG